MKYRNLLLVCLVAIACFGGSFNCHSSSGGHHNHDHKDDDKDDRD